MKVIDPKSDLVIASNIKVADSFWPRLIGFMFRKSPRPYDGIYFPNCKWVHNSFVRFPIDVVFINKDGVIVKLIRKFDPWQISGYCRTADSVLELAMNILPTTLNEGDKLKVEYKS
jgi:uncharacterized protein